MNVRLHGYTINEDARPWIYRRPRTASDPHPSDRGGTKLALPVVVRNGRHHPRSSTGCNLLRLEPHAFQLIGDEPTALSKHDFLVDNAKIEHIYYEEMKNVIQRYTGASQVVVLQHRVRSLHASPGNHIVNRFAHGIHTDGAELSAERAYWAALGKLSREWPGDASLGRFRSGRFVVLNAWRNIAADAPIQNDHLACCDATSLTPDDYILSDTFAERQNENYSLSAQRYQRHRWYYFPNMVQSEILLFKQWDSDPNQVGRTCFHTAFQDPTAPRGISARESIEVRAIAFFPNHRPSTCPTAPPVYAPAARLPNQTVSTKDVAAEDPASRILLALQHVERWPLPARLFVRGSPRTRAGAERVLDILCQDRRGRSGLQTATVKTRHAVKARLMANDRFYHAFASAKDTLEANDTARRVRVPSTWWLDPASFKNR